MITITSTFTADPIRNQLELLLNKFSPQKICFFYNQFFQQLLLPASEVNINNTGLNVVLIRLLDFFDTKYSPEVISDKISDLNIAFETSQKNMKVPMLVISTPNNCKDFENKIFFEKIEKLIQTNVAQYKNILFTGSQQILEIFNSKCVFDEFSEKHGHMPYTIDFYNILATTISRKFSLILRKPFKAIVLDCDGTLWDGVIEEDGINGIKIDDYYKYFYKFIIECFISGFLICLCSKNSEDSVISVFKNHRSMELSLEKHICTYRINWERKSKNIKSIAKELNIGLDSFIFVDDNKVECAEVKREIPEILAIELPKNKNDRVCYLRNMWAFDCIRKGIEDKDRTKFYQDNKTRQKIKEKSMSYSDFIKKLKIKTRINYATAKEYDRIYQLSQRTNQFNIHPNSMTAIEFNNSIEKNNPYCLSINVSDKFGDYGLVGVIVYEIDQKNLIIKSFFLSCRILGRGIEYDILKNLSDVIKNNDLEFIHIPFKMTERNIPAINFLKKISGKSDLKNLTKIILNSKQIHEIIFNPEEEDLFLQSDIIKKQKNYVSNDYMLEIALQSLINKNNKKNQKHKNMERNLIEIFTRHNINIEKNDIPFIYLGMDSLRSVLITSEIYQIYQIAISPLDLLDEKLTFNIFFKKISKNNKSKKMQIEVRYDPNEIPLSYSQKRLWYDEKISGFTNKNTMFIAYDIPTCLKIDILELSVIDLIKRHEALRFSFFEKNNEPFIKLNNTNDINFKVNYLKNPYNFIENEFIENFKYKYFNLNSPPLFRIGLIEKTNKSIILISLHHIIHDGWSLSIFLNELSIFYEARLKKIKCPLVEDAPSFIEFIHWQKNNISKNDLEKQKKFWEKFLFKIPKMELIYDTPIQEIEQKPISKRINFKLNISTTKNLKAVAKNNNITLYELLITSFSLLLSHYSNQNDINFVTAFSGRQNALSRNTIGFFVNLILIRIKINNNSLFYELLKNNKKVLNDVFINQDLPFNEILQITGESICSKTQVFNQAGFIFQNYPIPEFMIGGHKGERILSDDAAEILYDSCQECRFGNLVCFMQEKESNLYGLFEYNSFLFNEETINNIISSFKTLLNNITKKNLCPAMNVEILNEKQKKILLNKWNKPKKDFLNTGNLISFFLDQVVKNPNNIAIQHNKTVLTYIQLDQKSNSLAHKIQKYGTKLESPIGVFLDNKTEYVISIIAIIKSGGCYVPIEKNQPVERINYIIQDISLSHLITDNNGAHYIKDNIKLSLFLINIDENDKTSNVIEPINLIKKNNQLAYNMYTSGSTGYPKGVMIEQSGILRLVKATNYIKIHIKDRVAQTSNITFDAATFEIWGALLNGARLVITDKHTLLDSNSFEKFLKDQKISILFLTTQLFHSYSHSTPTLFEKLKYLVIGGEALLSGSVKNIFKEGKNPKILINGYGPTENTTFSTTYSVKNNKDILDPLPIGKPICGTEVYVLGENLNLVPIGAPGKLYLAGKGLTRGYVNHKYLNDKNFIIHFGKKLYNTGDIVSWQSDGNIRYIGRDDNQVKINGYRIELAEIESHLETHHLVEQGVVLVKNSKHQKQLYAYIMLKNGEILSEVNLYHHLKLTLPKYMIPVFYYQIKDIPVTNTGKVDRDLLYKMNLNYITYSEYESPSSFFQNELTKIYSKVLKIEKESIGVNTEFFDLGGNSILALTLINMISNKFNVKINFSTIYENSTIKSLSKKINYILNNNHFTSKKSQDEFIGKSLKKIKTGNSKNIPIVFVHPIGGTGFCYLDLIKLLPKEQPCYIIQDPSIDADKILFDDIPVMAGYYNDLLLKKFQSKKIILAGYSFGGMISMEMVHQLEKKNLGSSIKYILAFDTWVVSNFMNIKAKEALKKSILKQYERVLHNLTEENIDPKPWMELYYFRLQELGFTYIPPKISTKIILFKALQQAGEFSVMNDHANYLGPHTNKPIDVHMIPGNHDSILQQPNVKYISDIIILYIK